MNGSIFMDIKRKTKVTMARNLPIQAASHKKEKLSELEFRKMMMDWIVFSFREVDYGIDSIVEITQPIIGTNDDVVTNIKFSVQLKSTEKFDIKKDKITFSGVPLEKINYWCRGNLPTLFVVYDLSLEKFYYRWVDMELISELDKNYPKWRSQTSTTINIPIENRLDKTAFADIEDYVINYKRNYKRIIPSGTFFDLKKELSKISNSVAKINKMYPFDSISSQIEIIDSQLDKTMYKVTITGQTKAGKSSLINALLHRYISTEDILPLTGIPINFMAGREEYSEIVFNDGKKLKGGVDEAFLKKYISKDANKGNKLNVSLVNVVVNNHQLENGVMFSDVPGIDDLEERVQSYTWSTIDQSNAIIYVIDAMPYEGGGQVISYAIVNDLKKLIRTTGIDKVFILFNKVDKIKSNPISKLKKHIIQVLDDHEISKSIHPKLFYISAKQSFQLRTGKIKKGTDELESVEQEFWTYILNENKIGVYKIQKLLAEIDILCSNYSSLSKLALSRSKSFDDLKLMISNAREEDFPFIAKSLLDKQAELSKIIVNYITRRNEQTIKATEKWLQDSQKLPSIEQVKSFLNDQAKITMKTANEYLSKEFFVVKNNIDNWVEESLNKIRGNINDKTKYNVDLSNLNDFVVQDLSDFHVAIGVLNFSLLLVIAIEFPPVALFLGILSLLGWTSTADQRKRKNIDRIMQAVKEHNTNANNKITDKYKELIEKNILNLFKYGEDRLNIFLDDVEKEIIEKDAKPISSKSRAELEKNLKQIYKIKDDIQSLDRRIKLEFF